MSTLPLFVQTAREMGRTDAEIAADLRSMADTIAPQPQPAPLGDLLREDAPEVGTEWLRRQNSARVRVVSVNDGKVTLRFIRDDGSQGTGYRVAVANFHAGHFEAHKPTNVVRLHG